MQIEELWKSLETDAAAGKAGASGWLLRLARPTPECPLFVGIELASGRRAILLDLGSGPPPSRSLWPRSKGLEAFALVIDTKPHFGVALKQPRFADVFAALAEDLARRVTQAGTQAAQVRAFVGQLARWQKFLSASPEGLSEQAQRGLWGELYLLREHLIPLLGPAAARSWRGAERAHQDFQLKTGSIEVKTTLAKLPQVVRITSERQLDDRKLPALFLNVIAVDTAENGETLPGLVASLRSSMTNDAASQEFFEDELLQAGYLDAHAPRYAEQAYTIRQMNFFRVGTKFPRLVEADMPPGVGDANYALTVPVCEPFRIQPGEMAAVLVGGTHQKPGSKKHV